MRKKILAANWKMYKTPDQATAFFQEFLPLVQNHDRDDIVLCPNYIALQAAVHAAKGSRVAIGAQNLHFRWRSCDSLNRHWDGAVRMSGCSENTLSFFGPRPNPWWIPGVRSSGLSRILHIGSWVRMEIRTTSTRRLSRDGLSSGLLTWPTGRMINHGWITRRRLACGTLRKRKTRPTIVTRRQMFLFAI